MAYKSKRGERKLECASNNTVNKNVTLVLWFPTITSQGGWRSSHPAEQYNHGTTAGDQHLSFAFLHLSFFGWMQVQGWTYDIIHVPLMFPTFHAHSQYTTIHTISHARKHTGPQAEGLPRAAGALAGPPCAEAVASDRRTTHPPWPPFQAPTLLLLLGPDGTGTPVLENKIKVKHERQNRTPLIGCHCTSIVYVTGFVRAASPVWPPYRDRWWLH